MADKAKAPRRKGRQLAYYVPENVYKRLCRVADRREALSGLPVTHTEILRKALVKYLSEEEAELGINGKAH